MHTSLSTNNCILEADLGVARQLCIVGGLIDSHNIGSQGNGRHECYERQNDGNHSVWRGIRRHDGNDNDDKWRAETSVCSSSGYKEKKGYAGPRLFFLGSLRKVVQQSLAQL